MRDYHFYIIVALLLVVLLSMSRSEGFVTKSAAHASHASPAKISRQIGGPHTADFQHWGKCALEKLGGYTSWDCQ
jgi:hypothetical protein